MSLIEDSLRLTFAEQRLAQLGHDVSENAAKPGLHRVNGQDLTFDEYLKFADTARTIWPKTDKNVIPFPTKP